MSDPYDWQRNNEGSIDTNPSSTGPRFDRQTVDPAGSVFEGNFFAKLFCGCCPK